MPTTARSADSMAKAANQHYQELWSEWNPDMSKHGKLLAQILNPNAHTSVRFEELCFLLKHLGFTVRIRGSHFIFRRPGVIELLNLQRDGALAKPYQIRQVRSVILKHGLHVQGVQ